MHIVLLKDLFAAIWSSLFFDMQIRRNMLAGGEVNEENAEANVLCVGS